MEAGFSQIHSHMDVCIYDMSGQKYALLMYTIIIPIIHMHM